MPSALQAIARESNAGALGNVMQRKSSDDNKKKAPQFWRKLSVQVPNLFLAEARIRLKPEITLSGAFGIMIGSVIGSGIFISPKGVLVGTGSVALCLIIWGCCGLITLLGALTFSELGTRITDTGGSYIYLLEAFAPNRHKVKSFWGPLPAFLYNWQANLIMFPAAAAVSALTCAEYAVRLTSLDCTENQTPDIAVKFLACGILCVIATINICSVKAATNLQILFASGKVAALFLVVVSAAVFLGNGIVGDLPKGFTNSTTSFAMVAMSFYSGLFSFIGWQDLNFVTKEMKNPVRDLPLAVVGATSFVGVFYVLMNAAYFIVLSTDELLTTDTVAVAFGYKVAGRVGSIIMIIFVTLTTFGSANTIVFTSGRLSYTSAKEGHMVDCLSYIHRERNTPTPSIICNTLLASLMVLPSNLNGLIALNGFCSWTFVGATEIALLLIKYRTRHIKPKLEIPIIIPIIVLVFSTILVATPLVIEPQIEYFSIVLFLFVGFLAYVVFVYYEVSCYGIGTLKKWLQITLNIIPAEA